MSVTASVADGVGRILLDRPPANSYDTDFIDALDRAISEVAAAGVAAVIVASASEKFFSAGADVKGFLARAPEANLAMVRRAHEVFDRFASEAPVFIAAIAGHALGGGYEIALACDIRVAAEGRYTLGLPEVTLGLLPGTGGTQRLPRLIGASRALELMAAGRTVGPEEAHRLGMIDRLVAADALDTTVEEMARTLAGGAPLAIRAIKRAVYEGAGRPLSEALQRELELLEPLFASADAHEGMTAFTERRPPTYVGK